MIQLPEIEFDARTPRRGDFYKSPSMCETLERAFERDSADRIEDHVRAQASRRLTYRVAELSVGWYETVDRALGRRTRFGRFHVDADDQRGSAPPR